MIIGIDIRILGNNKRGGIVEYTEQVVSNLIAQAPEHQFKLFFSSIRRQPPDYSWLHAPNVKLYFFKIPNGLLFLFNRIFQYPKLDKMMGGADLFFSPHFFLASLSDRCRRVTTFHDLSYIRFPEFFTIEKRLWHTFKMNPFRQARFSQPIIADSESTRFDLAKFYMIDPVNIKVVNPGLSLKASDNDLSEFRLLKNVPDRFILSLSTLEPRKNISAVIEAFNKLKEISGYENLWLLIGGPRGWLYKDILAKAKKSPYKKQIRFLGYVPDHEREYYYRTASVFVYPSFFEGFGFPILEAMACGAPVITAANSSLPEVAGDAALMVSPNNISDLVLGIRTILEDTVVREKLIKNGLKRAGQFTWERCAKELLKIFISPQS